MEVTYKVKSMFFDRKAVAVEIGKENAAALGKAGAFIRRRAASSMRRRKSPSAPGTPPSAHSKDKIASLKNILFAYDRQRQSVVVGPVRLNMVTRGAVGLGNATVPQLMEHGGVARIQEEQNKIHLGAVITPSQMRRAAEKQWFRSDLRRNKKPWKNYRIRVAHYAPRPFMGPALVKEAPNIPQLYGSRGGSAAA